jgi:hypothetical protein
MRKLSRWLVPFSRTTILLWTWRNRATVMEWLTFGLRAVASVSEGKGLDDAKAEFRLRAHLARDPRTRTAILDVEVADGVAHLSGRASPEVHAVVQDITVATRGIARIDDRITHSAGRGGLLRRRARAAA